MSSQLSSDIILLLLVLLAAFVPVLQSSKAPRKLAASTEQYRKTSFPTESSFVPVLQSSKAPRKFVSPTDQYRRASSPTQASNEKYYRNSFYSERQANVMTSRKNNVIVDERLQDTLLKPKQDNRYYYNTMDSKHTGVRSYRKKYPAPRRRYYDSHEIDNSIHRKPEKYYYPKDHKKHTSRNRAMEKPKEHEWYHTQKTTLTLPKTVHPTVESVQKEDHSSFSNLPEQVDWDLSEMSNSSFNESSNSNSSFSSPSSSSSSSNSKCPTCRMRDGDRLYRIEKLKQNILGSLHMTTPPNASNVTIPKMPAMVKFYNMDEDMMNDSPYSKRTNNDEDFRIKTERIFTKARQPPSQELLNITNALYFAPPISLYTSKIKTAYLWFYVRRRDIKRPYIHLSIERILPESVPANRLVKKTIYSQSMLKRKAFGWKRINLREVLKRWVSHPMSNHGIQIQALDDQGNNLVVLTPSEDVDKGYEPWLDTKVYEPTSNSRHRRSQSLFCDEYSSESRCCRYPLTITFAEFGWEWIIAPTRVEVNYCSGECEMTMQNTSPISWFHQQVPSTGSSCCAPSKLQELPMLYFDAEHNVYYQILQGMIVQECGCT